MDIHYINIAGKDVTLITLQADWTDGVRVQHRINSEVTTLESGKEIRRAKAATMLLTQAYDLLLIEDEAEELRIACGNLEAEETVAVPLWPDAWPKAEYESKRRYAPRYVVNFEEGVGADVYAADSIPVNPTYKYTAPLLVGKLLTEIRFKAIGSNRGRVRVTLAEDSPYAFRIDANDFAVGADWPVSLVPDYSSELTEVARNGYRRTLIGNLRERQADGHERINWWERMGRFQLFGDEIGTLLDFWSGKLGRVQSFLAPAWFTPGAPTLEAPHGFVSRFDSENLDVAYVTPNVANTSLRLVTLPWEAIDSTPYQKPQKARLFEFTYKTPTPVVWRFTDYEAAIVNTEGTWNPAPFELTSRNSRDLKLTAKSFRVESHSFAGNPLDMFHPYGLEAPLWLTIKEVEVDDVEAMTILRVGKLTDVMQRSRALEAEFEPFGGLLDSPFPTFKVQDKCNWQLFSPQCGLSKAAYQKTGTISAVTGSEIVATTAATEASGWFAFGFVEVSDGLTYERRGIIGSVKGTGTQTLTLSRPLRVNGVGASIAFYPGCDGRGSTCRGKFSNVTNFSGFEFIPETSPTNEVPVQQGEGKK